MAVAVRVVISVGVCGTGVSFFEVQVVSHAFFLCVQVFLVVFVGCYLDWHVFHYFESESIESSPLGGVVCDEAHLAHTYFAQYLCPHAVVAFIGVVAQASVMSRS